MTNLLRAIREGDLLHLSGKTRHGKNRIREQGKYWRVVKIKGALPGGRYPGGTTIAELETLDHSHWRLISVNGDTDFDFHRVASPQQAT
jgi:hypothetical protein